MLIMGYLGTSSDVGFYGAALFAIWGAIIIMLLPRSKIVGRSRHEMRDLRIAFLSSAVAFMVMCFTLDALGYFTVAKYFWVVIALAVVFSRFEVRMAGSGGILMNNG